jgi:D-3-phosphoglycerate dehydrogenase
MACQELDDFLANGNIKNSVNYPAVSMPRSGDCRICIMNANVPAVMTGITRVLSEQGVNIENLTNKSRGNVAYSLVDITGKLDDQTEQMIEAIEGIIRVRVID